MSTIPYLQAVKQPFFAWKHWPDTHVFITRPVKLWNRWVRLKLWNRWVRLSCYIQQSIEHVSIVYTCITYFVMHWFVWFIREYLVNVLMQYLLISQEDYNSFFCYQLFELKHLVVGVRVTSKIPCEELTGLIPQSCKTRKAWRFKYNNSTYQVYSGISFTYIFTVMC